METFAKMSVPRDMNEVRDIILQWEKGFDSEEEKFFFYLAHCATLHEEYWDMMPILKHNQEILLNNTYEKNN